MRPLQRIAQLGAIATCMLVLGWAVSRLITDRFSWSQYAWWAPTWVWGAAAGFTLWISCLAHRRARGWLRGVRWAAGIGVLGVIAYFGVAECRVYRLPGRVPLGMAAQEQRGMRILFWNPSSVWGADLPKWMTSVPADLVVITNPNWDKPMSLIGKSIGRPWYLPVDRFVVFSRDPILRWGVGSLGLHGREQAPSATAPLGEAPGSHIDAGSALWFEIDARAPLGRTVIVWVLDLPSDERLGRWETAQAAAAAMRAWPGPAISSDRAFAHHTQAVMTGFPAPDLVIGDLNSPRGSASIGVLAPGMREAYSQAGAGYVATFPERFPVVHIDQILTGPGLRATDYRVIDPRMGRHLLQWARVEGSGKDQAAK